MSKKTAEDQAQEQIRILFERGLKLTEQLLNRIDADAEVNCEACGGKRVSIDTLMELHRSITVWAAKFSASEAPKRLKLEGGATINHVLMSDETIRRLTAFGAKYEATLLPVIDVNPEPSH